MVRCSGLKTWQKVFADRGHLLIGTATPGGRFMRRSRRKVPCHGGRGRLPGRSSGFYRSSVHLEGVLDLFAGLIQVRFDLTFAFSLETVVTRCLACGFLALAAQVSAALWILSPNPMVFL